MIEKLDQTIFLFLNSFNSPWWDKVMVVLSARLTWLPLYLFILVLLSLKHKRSMLIIVPVIILTIAAADQLSVHAFKEVFLRLRPCHEPELQGLVHTVNDRCGGMYGFVSSHAANSFAVAVLSLGLLNKRWYTILIICWATLVSYSRIYLGVHYPGDIIGGAALGASLACLSLALYRFIRIKFMEKSSFFITEKKNNADN